MGLGSWSVYSRIGFNKSSFAVSAQNEEIGM